MGGRGSGAKVGMLLPHERRKWLLDLIRYHGNVRSNDQEIVARFLRETGVNCDRTFRMDLRALADDGLVTRKHMADCAYRYAINVE